MNLIGHYVCASHTPLDVRLGSVLPDLVSIYRRKVRVRWLTGHWESSTGIPDAYRGLLAGISFHHQVDSHFHKASFFKFASGGIHQKLLAASTSPGLKRFLPAHVLSELFFDHLLIAREPDLPGRFNEDLRRGSATLAAFVGVHPLAEEGSFGEFLERLEAYRIVEDYRELEGIMFRMNRILVHLSQRPLENGEERAVAGFLTENAAWLDAELNAFAASMKDGFKLSPKIAGEQAAPEQDTPGGTLAHQPA
ncbi:MAG: hypothetical protein V3S64_14795 [bacterium]